MFAFLFLIDPKASEQVESFSIDLIFLCINYSHAHAPTHAHAFSFARARIGTRAYVNVIQPPTNKKPMQNKVLQVQQNQRIIDNQKPTLKIKCTILIEHRVIFLA